jgi:glucokinase-like ROK family protein
VRWAIGIDVGGTKIAGALVNEAGQSRGFMKRLIPAKGEPSVVALQETAQQLLTVAAGEGCAVEGIGIAVPGAVDVEKGIVVRAPNLDWDNLAIRERFEAALEVPIEVELDVRAAALGAMLTDLARDVQDFVYVTIGTGIGAGIVVRGELYHGFHSCSGEIGHCVLVADGPRCGCGQRGCFEALAAGPAIAARAGHLVQQTPLPSVMSDQIDEDGIEPDRVFEAAQKRDPLACEVVRATAEHLGRGLSILINVLDPQKVIIGGGVAQGGLPLLQLIRQYTAQYTLHRACKQTEIVLSPDVDCLPVVGAANLIFKRRSRP